MGVMIPLVAAQLPTETALRRICLDQLHAIEQHRPGARLGRDPEALHDLRVAVRRTRCVLAEFRNVLPAEAGGHFRNEFRWVGEISGPVRDLDVYLEHLPDYYALLAGDAVADLAPFRRFLLRHRWIERRRLVRRLDSRRFEGLLIDWKAFLTVNDGVVWPVAAGQAVGEMARRRIWKRYRALVREGAAIAADTPDQALHRLRISGKKLRYLLEFFRPLYPTAELDTLIKAMKGLQDFLGAYQDCTVQQLRLRELAGQMAVEGGVPVATAAALENLIEILQQRRKRLRRRFAECFAVFSHGRARRGFVRLFTPKGK
jgi:CHAD domain-containing protein